MKTETEKADDGRSSQASGYAERRDFLRAKWGRYKLRCEFRAKRAAGVKTWIKWVKCPHGVAIWDAREEPIETHPKWVEAFSDETECERRQNDKMRDARPETETTNKTENPNNG